MRAVFFDAGGTLIEPSEPIGRTYLRYVGAGSTTEASVEESFRAALRAMPPMVFASRSLDETVEKERAWWRRVVAETFRTAGGPIDDADGEQRFADLFSHFARPQAWRLVPKAADVLGDLRERGLFTGIVSNFDRRLPPILAGLGIAGLLDVVALPSDAGAAKPDARIFQFALARLGVEPRDALHVGDDPIEDLAAARAAGLSAVDIATLSSLDDLIELAGRG